MIPTKSALLLGASGLTGGHLLDLLLTDDAYHSVTIFVRKPTGIHHPKLEEKMVDYDDWQEAVVADDVFCCLGTTIKKAKTKEAFTKVDLLYPVRIAQLQYKAGSKKFLVVSAMGVAKDSFFFYSRVKAEMEEQLQQIGYESLFIFRPSLITGNRKENRAGESIAIRLFTLINPLLMGPLRKYKSVSANAIAKAMVHEAQTDNRGTQILLSDELKKFE